MTTDFKLLCTRRFEMLDQNRFAEASGDVNPMHMDPIAARRTQAGIPAVHGMNALLWAVDFWLQSTETSPIVGIAARFDRFVGVGDLAELWVRSSGQITRLEVRTAGGRAMRFDIRHAVARKVLPSAEVVSAAVPIPARPLELDFLAASGALGRLEIPDASELYPRLTSRIGGDRVSALAALSALIGMVVPGLHSIFSSFDLALIDPIGPQDGLSYRVAQVHEVYRLVQFAVAGPRLHGEVEAFVRLPPVSQPATSELRGQIARDAFVGTSALVVGGSRGLGELTAKLLAAGGARLAISYAVGATDAERVADDIRAAGGNCTTLRLNALEPAAPQLALLDFEPTQLYYFATTRIFLQKGDGYSPEIFADFTRIYVDGFADICRALSEMQKGQIMAFYPSSVAVDVRPSAMTEYAMAKAAAELLCVDIDRFLPRVRTLVRRLPRLLTDQTATITPIETPSGVDMMRDVVLAMAEASARAKTL